MALNSAPPPKIEIDFTSPPKTELVETTKTTRESDTVFGHDEKTNLALLQMMVPLEWVKENDDDDETDSVADPEPNNSNINSEPKIQAIQEHLVTEFGDEINSILEAITAEYIDKDLLQEKLKILKKLWRDDDDDNE